MRVSRNFKVDDWTALKFKTEADWETAVKIFVDRLDTRYIEHTDVLVGLQTSGFVVLALDCALVETLQQFRKGTQSTPQAKGKQYFTEFLTETAFAEHFDEEKAALFYKTIRCGLLHQSEADGSSRITRGADRAVVTYYP